MTSVKSPVVIVPLFLEFPLAIIQRANLTSANEKCSGNETTSNSSCRHGRRGEKIRTCPPVHPMDDVHDSITEISVVMKYQIGFMVMQLIMRYLI